MNQDLGAAALTYMIGHHLFWSLSRSANKYDVICKIVPRMTDPTVSATAPWFYDALSPGYSLYFLINEDMLICH